MMCLKSITDNGMKKTVFRGRASKLKQDPSLLDLGREHLYSKRTLNLVLNQPMPDWFQQA